MLMNVLKHIVFKCAMRISKYTDNVEDLRLGLFDLKPYSEVFSIKMINIICGQIETFELFKGLVQKRLI